MRLTYKDNRVVGGYNAVDTDEFACVTKLGQLEDIEDELGIDLVTLVEALKNGAKFGSGKVLDIPFEHYEYHTLSLRFDFIDNEWILVGSGYKLRLKDYGKTWALARKELS